MVYRRSLRFAGGVIAASFAFAAAAQDWDWRITPYIWTTGIEGDVALGTVGRPVNVEFSELVDIMSGTALLHVESERDGHVLFGDLVWVKLEPEAEPGTIGGRTEAEFDSTTLELGYARNTVGVFGLEVGVRYWDFELALDPELLPGVERGDRWTDVFGGIRATGDIGENWALTTRANIGGGGADLTVGLQMDFARELASGNAVVAGLKLIAVDYEKDAVGGIPLVLDATYLGATIGFTFD